MRYQYEIITTGAGIVDWKQGVFEKKVKFLKIIEIFEKHGFCGVAGSVLSGSKVLISVPRVFRMSQVSTDKKIKWIGQVDPELQPLT